MTSDAAQDTPGFFGKLPGRGDFVTRRLPRPMVQTWDQWLAQGIESSQQALGGRWLEVYLSSPLWRFHLTPGVCGDSAWAGIMMPSVDRVGRYFPLTVAVAVPRHVGASRFLREGASWFEHAESLMLSVLDEHQHGFDLDGFSAAVAALGQPAANSDSLGPLPVAGAPVRVEVADVEDVAPVHDVIASAAFHAAHPQVTVWWTSGSEHVAPCMLYASGLPAPDYFASMLAGDVNPAGTWSPPVPAPPPASVPMGYAERQSAGPGVTLGSVPEQTPATAGHLASAASSPPPREPTDVTVPTVRSDSTVPKRPTPAADGADE